MPEVLHPHINFGNDQQGAQKSQLLQSQTRTQARRQPVMNAIGDVVGAAHSGQGTGVNCVPTSARESLHDISGGLFS